MAAPPLPLAQIARATHDVGLAGLLGGNLFGRVALHPSVTEIADPAVRGKVVNAAWRRYGTVNSLGLLAVVGGWAGTRATNARDDRLSDTEQALARVKDVLVGVVAVTGVATAIAGVRFAKQEPGGAVPLEDGSTAAPEATEAETKGKQLLDRLGLLGLVAEIGIVGVDAALAEQHYRRPGLPRLINR